MTTPAPSVEASEVFADVWPLMIDLAKETAPILIGASLTLLAIQWVTNALSKGRSPEMVTDERGRKRNANYYQERMDDANAREMRKAARGS